MKRYERMSKEDIIKVVAEAGYNTDFCKTKCREDSSICSGRCCENVSEWLNEEVAVKKVPRFTTIKTVDEMREIYSTFAYECDKTECEDCRFRESEMFPWSCFVRFLCEEVEVEEESE